MKNKEIKFYKLFKPIAIDSRLTSSGRLVATYIYTFESFGKKCYASNTKIANALGLSSSTVDGAIKDLEYYGLINDKRIKQSKGNIKVCCPKFCDSDFYKVNSKILKSNLKLSSKLVLSYVKSFQSAGKICYAGNVAISRDICVKPSTIGDIALPELQKKGLIMVLHPKGLKRQLILNENYQDYLKPKKKTIKKEVVAVESSNLFPNSDPSSQKMDNNLTETVFDFPKTGLNLPDSRHYKKNNNINNKKTYNKSNKEQMGFDLDLKDLNNKLLQLMKVHIKSQKTEESVKDFELISHISNLPLHKKIELTKKLESDYGNTISLSTEKEFQNNTIQSSLDFQSEKEIENISSTEEKVEVLPQHETKREVTNSTENKALELSIETLLNTLSELENNSISEASRALSTANIKIEETLSRENFEVLNKIPDFTNFINDNNKLIAYYHVLEGEKHYSLYSKIDEKLYAFSMPPFGFDERLFCIANHSTMECEANSPELIKLEDVNFMTRISSMQEIDEEEYLYKYLSKICRLDKFQGSNFEFYSSYMDDNKPLIPTEIDESDTSLLGEINTEGPSFREL